MPDVRAMERGGVDLPQGNAAEIAGLAVGPSPTETFFIQTEVFGHGQNGIRQAFV